jgi:two-component system NtrC family sensor kinase
MAIQFCNDTSWFVCGTNTHGISGTYNISVVILSYLIALLGSYVALTMVGRMRAEVASIAKYYWLVGGAIVMGSSIWSMHFVGLLAYVLEVQVSYSLGFTALSYIAAIFASGVAFYVLQERIYNNLYRILAGVIMGIAISLMHYLGMQAIVGTHVLAIRYFPTIFGLSIVIAVLASEAALWLAIKSNQEYESYQKTFLLQISSAVVMGIAICGMHYTGMAAAVFIPAKEHLVDDISIHPLNLVISITVLMALIIVSGFFASLFRQIKLSQLARDIELKYVKEIKQANDMLEQKINDRTMEISQKNTELSITIHDLKRLQENLVQSEKLATVGKLASGAAHEINNPLSFTLSNLSALKKRTQNLSQYISLFENLLPELKTLSGHSIEQKIAEIIEFKGVKKVSNCILDIKDIIDESTQGLTRIQEIVTNLQNYSGVQQENKERVNLNSIIASALEMIHSEIKYKCEVVKKFDDLPFTLASKQQLKVLIINLVLNASQAIADKGIIMISTSVSRGHIVLSVQDTGVGISPDNLNRIFDPFFTTREVGGGSGLGLSTAAGIARFHGGSIRVESQLGVGSTFILSLPITTRTE